VYQQGATDSHVVVFRSSGLQTAMLLCLAAVGYRECMMLGLAAVGYRQCMLYSMWRGVAVSVQLGTVVVSCHPWYLFITEILMHHVSQPYLIKTKPKLSLTQT